MNENKNDMLTPKQRMLAEKAAQIDKLVNALLRGNKVDIGLVAYKEIQEARKPGSASVSME